MPYTLRGKRLTPRGEEGPRQALRGTAWKNKAAYFLHHSRPPSVPSGWLCLKRRRAGRPIREQRGVLPFGAFDDVFEAETASEKGPPSRASYLKKLTIQDFVLVKWAEVSFDPGFNVVTGESGAGKSVLIEALNQVLGKTPLGNCIRPSCEKAVLEATLHVAPRHLRQLRALFRQFDLQRRFASEHQDGAGTDVLLRREIFPTGSGLRSRCFLNGTPVSVRALKAVAEEFFDINGQYAVTQLGDKRQQMRMIDQMTGRSELKKEIGRIFDRMTELKSMLAVTSEFEDPTIRDEAQNFCDKVQDAGLEPGEERHLSYGDQPQSRRHVSFPIVSCQDLALGYGASESIVYALQDVTSRIKAIVRQEQRNADFTDTEEDEAYDPDTCDRDINCALHCLDDALDHLEKAEAEIRTAAEHAMDFASYMKFDAVDREDIKKRLKNVEKLLQDCRCVSSEELLDLASETQTKLDQYHESCGKRTNWEGELAFLEESYIQKSVQLSLCRRDVAGKLRKAIEDCLYDLAMQHSRFDVSINWEQTAKPEDGIYVASEAASKAGERGDGRYHATASGFDSVEFLLAPGPAEPLRALSGVASGGESARIMLAFKAAPTLVGSNAVHASEDRESDAPGAVLVLDELDTGVGVRLGETVGKLLHSICTNAEESKNQVICVSHLPQVAAYASTHIKASKTIDEGGKMVIRFSALQTESERSEEINAMMGSSEKVGDELLNDARSQL